MNSDNQGVKETFIQNSRRGGLGKAVDCTDKVELTDQETKDSKPLAIKHCGGCKKAGETHSLTGAFGV